MAETNTPLEFNQCQEAVRRLNDYLSHELDTTELDVVQQHLSECKGCFDKFRFEETLLRTIRQKAEHVAAPPALRNRILNLLGKSDVKQSGEED
jgi:anti-sigma factor (TIGR02949 family)